MDREKMIARYYLDTGILGAYETTEVIHEEEENGKYAPCFEDALVTFDTEQRSMGVCYVVLFIYKPFIKRLEELK